MPQPLKPECPRARAPQQEKPLLGEACAPQLGSRLALCNQRKAHAATKTPPSQKEKQTSKIIF